MPDRSTPPKSFWIIAAIALVWNLMGVAAYLMQMTMSDEAIAALPEAQRALHESTPAWATGAYALAVPGGHGFAHRKPVAAVRGREVAFVVGGRIGPLFHLHGLPFLGEGPRPARAALSAVRARRPVA